MTDKADTFNKDPILTVLEKSGATDAPGAFIKIVGIQGTINKNAYNWGSSEDMAKSAIEYLDGDDDGLRKAVFLDAFDKEAIDPANAGFLPDIAQYADQSLLNLYVNNAPLAKMTPSYQDDSATKPTKVQNSPGDPAKTKRKGNGTFTNAGAIPPGAKNPGAVSLVADITPVVTGAGIDAAGATGAIVMVNPNGASTAGSVTKSDFELELQKSISSTIAAKLREGADHVTSAVEAGHEAIRASAERLNKNSFLGRLRNPTAAKVATATAATAGAVGVDATVTSERRKNS